MRQRAAHAPKSATHLLPAAEPAQRAQQGHILCILTGVCQRDCCADDCAGVKRRECIDCRQGEAHYGGVRACESAGACARGVSVGGQG
jgi:hypothetical protein